MFIAGGTYSTNPNMMTIRTIANTVATNFHLPMNNITNASSPVLDTVASVENRVTILSHNHHLLCSEEIIITKPIKKTRAAILGSTLPKDNRILLRIPECPDVTGICK